MNARSSKTNLTRRDFVVASTTAAGGLAITVMLPGFADARRSAHGP